MPKNDTIDPIAGSLDEVVTSIVKISVDQKREERKKMRISEQDLYIPALRLANERPGGFIPTSDLIQELSELFNPGVYDNEILEGRSDTRFSQKVRNLVSHRESPKSPIMKGFAEYDDKKKGIQITIKGRNYLEQLF